MIALLVLVAVAQTEPSAPHPDAIRKERLENLLGPPPSEPVAVERPDPLRLREPWIALTLGGAVGFGTGHYYAGNSARGGVMSAVDTVLSVGTLWVAFRYRDEVADTDLVLGVGRERTDREEALRSGLVALATGLVLSRVYQAVFSYLDAEATNRRLEDFSFVPLPQR